MNFSILFNRVDITLVAKQSKDWNFIKYITKRMLIYQHSFSFQMVSRK